MPAADNHINYTSADFMRYHSGTMNDAEMHAMEKAALEDPFLSDALEGYFYTQSAVADADVLRKRLDGKEGKKKPAYLFTGKYRWLKAASVVLLIAGTFYISLKINEKRHPSGFAKNIKKQVGETQMIPANSTNNNDHDSQKENTITASPDSTVDKALTAKNDEIKSQKKIIFQSDADGKTKRLIALQHDDISKNNYDKEAKETNLLKDQQPVADENARFETGQKTSTYTFSGIALNDNGTPLAFVNIKDKAGKISGITDSAGKFFIHAPDSNLLATFSVTGFTAVTAMLKNNVHQTINLTQAATALDEVSVTGYGNVRSKKSEASQMISGKVTGIPVIPKPVPVNGWKKFNDDLRDSISLLHASDSTLIKGDVILSFRIKKNGALKNIHIDKSLCESCDKVAIRLLLSGPRWRYINDKRSIINISF